MALKGDCVESVQEQRTPLQTEHWHVELTNSDVGKSVQRSGLGSGGNCCRILLLRLNGLL